MIAYGITKVLHAAFDDARSRVVAALAQEGFGILTEIDVREKLREKLGKEMPKHLILGACNPPKAYAAIEAERGIGLLLPCNVILYEGDGYTPGSEDGTVTVAAVRPSTAMGMVKNRKLAAIAQEVEERLRRVIASLEKEQ